MAKCDLQKKKKSNVKKFAYVTNYFVTDFQLICLTKRFMHKALFIIIIYYN